MGTAVVGRCKCGYETKEMFLGGGRMNFQSHCGFPYYCQDCQILFEANIYEDVICSECKNSNVISYDDARACQFMERSVFDWNTDHKLGRNLKLSASNNLCPKCGNFDLSFAMTMMYD